MILTAILTSVVLGAAPPPVGAPELEARWRSEYPAASARLEALAGGFQAEGKCSGRYFNGETFDTRKLIVASSAGKQLFVRDDRTMTKGASTKPFASDVACRTPDFAFGLKRSSGSGPYAISYHAARLAGDESFKYDFDLYTRSATMYMQDTLLHRMQSPGFKLRTIAEQGLGGDRVVRVEYEYDARHVAETGAVYLDPARDWAIRKVDVVTRSKMVPRYEFKSEVEYAKVGDNVFFPKHMEYKGGTGHPGVFEQGRVDLGRVAIGGAADRSFKLSGYGLPDLPLGPGRAGSPISPSNPLLWLILATSVLSFALFRASRTERSPLVLPA